MGEVITLSGENADLEKPVWFYKRVDELAETIYDDLREMWEAAPNGGVTIDEIYLALAETPVRLMALAQGDAELETFIGRAAIRAVGLDLNAR